MYKVLTSVTGFFTGAPDAPKILLADETLVKIHNFTDISSGCLVAAKKRFKRLANIEYTTLGISKKPDDQGFEGSQYDLVIATNLIHTP